MGFFDFFRTKPVEVTEQQPTEELKPEINEEDFIDNSNPDGNDIYTITYGTGFAIDAIYAFLRKDNEQKGFDDAMVNPENSYKEAGVSLIENELRQLFEQVRLRYRNDLRILQVQIDNMEKQGLPHQAANLYARKETYEEHMKKIGEMETKVQQKESSVMSPIYSYERGFLKGLAAKSEIIINGNNERRY